MNNDAEILKKLIPEFERVSLEILNLNKELMDWYLNVRIPNLNQSVADTYRGVPIKDVINYASLAEGKIINLINLLKCMTM